MPRHRIVTMSVAMNFEPDPVRNDLGTNGNIWPKKSEITLPSPIGNNSPSSRSICVSTPTCPSTRKMMKTLRPDRAERDSGLASCCRQAHGV